MPSVIMEHKCYCDHCCPEKFPQGGRDGEGHIAIRLGDPPDAYWNFRVNGELVYGTYEANPYKRYVTIVMHAGRRNTPVDTFVRAYSHRCKHCREGVCKDVLYGDVTVEYRQELKPCLAR